MKIEFVCYGHENVSGKHYNTLEFTKEDYITKRADCIIGLNCNFSIPKEFILPYVKVKLKITNLTNHIEDELFGYINPNFSSDSEIVLRKTAFSSERTLLIKANKASRDLDHKVFPKAKHEKILVSLEHIFIDKILIDLDLFNIINKIPSKALDFAFNSSNKDVNKDMTDDEFLFKLMSILKLIVDVGETIDYRPSKLDKFCVRENEDPYRTLIFTTRVEFSKLRNLGYSVFYIHDEFLFFVLSAIKNFFQNFFQKTFKYAPAVKLEKEFCAVLKDLDDVEFMFNLLNSILNLKKRIDLRNIKWKLKK